MKNCCYKDIVVVPYRGTVPGQCGGPIFNDFENLTWQRHNRYGMPDDYKPDNETSWTNVIKGDSVWCGPLYFGVSHQFAEFMHRIPPFNKKYDNIIFSAHAENYEHTVKYTLPLVNDALEYLGYNKNKVVIVKEPTIVESLVVFEQGEQLGVPPKKEYISYLNQKQKENISNSFYKNKTIYLSRAGLDRGKIIGESYIESILLKQDVSVIRPENITLNELYNEVASCDYLILSEGGVSHILSLLGSLPKKVVMLARRDPESISSHYCEMPLKERTENYRRIDCCMHYLSIDFEKSKLIMDSKNDPNSISLPDISSMLKRLKDVGININYNRSEFLSSALLDLFNFKRSFIAKSMKTNCLEKYYLRMNEINDIYYSWIKESI